MKGLVVGTFNEEKSLQQGGAFSEVMKYSRNTVDSSNSLAYSELCGRGVGLCLNVELQASDKQCSQNNPAGSFGFFTREQIETKTVQ